MVTTLCENIDSEPNSSSHLACPACHKYTEVDGNCSVEPSRGLCSSSPSQIQQL